MELFSKKFEFAVRAIFKNKNLQIVATVPFKGRFNIVEELKQNENSKLFAVIISKYKKELVLLYLF